MVVQVFVVVDLTCTEVGPVRAGHTVRSPSVGHQHFIYKSTDQYTGTRFGQFRVNECSFWPVLASFAPYFGESF